MKLKKNKELRKVKSHIKTGVLIGLVKLVCFG